MKTHVCPKCGTPVENATAHGVTFVHETGVVTYQGRTCRLTATQLDILEHLLDAWPRGIRRDRLYAELYAERHDDEMPGYNTVNVIMSQMRRVFEAAGVAIRLGCRHGKLERAEYFLSLGESEEQRTEVA